MRRLLSPLLLFSFSALFCLAQAQGAKDPSANPYSADVRRALAPPPGDTGRRPVDGGQAESPACRELRMKLERLRQAPPVAEIPGAGSSRSARTPNGTQPGAPAYQQQTLEVRYQTECR